MVVAARPSNDGLVQDRRFKCKATTQSVPPFSYLYADKVISVLADDIALHIRGVPGHTWAPSTIPACYPKEPPFGN